MTLNTAQLLLTFPIVFITCLNHLNTIFSFLALNINLTLARAFKLTLAKARRIYRDVYLISEKNHMTSKACDTNWLWSRQGRLLFRFCCFMFSLWIRAQLRQHQTLLDWLSRTCGTGKCISATHRWPYLHDNFQHVWSDICRKSDI